jgi:hypothetical protein
MVSETDSFPFARVLSLAPLIDYWRDAARGSGVHAAMAAAILPRIEAVPELGQPITDFGVLEANRDLVDALMSAVFPPASDDEVFGCAAAPFDLRVVYETRGFRELGLLNRMRELLRQDRMQLARGLVAYHYLLARVYGRGEVDFHIPFPFSATDASTGLERSFSLTIEPHFCRVVQTGPAPSLTDAQIDRLLADRLNLPLWLELIPPASFEMRGFVVFNAVDVTDQQVLAALTSDLLRTNAMASAEKIDILQDRLRTLLRRPHLRLGLISLDRDEADAIDSARPVGRSLLLSRVRAPDCPYRAHSYYTRVVETRQPTFVQDLCTCEVQTNFEASVRAQGVRNLLIAPLQIGERLVGLLELASPNPGELDALNSARLQEVLGLFAIAMKRMLDERETRIQAVIKQQYTAIHPAIEWRFRQAAGRMLEQEDAGEYAAPEPIVFADVYPLYGLSDIRGSSSQRNLAIQADLIEQLKLARAAIGEANRGRPLPVLAELDHRILTFMDGVEEGLRAGDEIRVLDFLRTELADVFAQLGDFGEATARVIRDYQQALDPQLGFLYRQRARFEESVTRITDAISAYIDREQAQAQAMFPHYFEKFKTDGVDYNLYVGASLQQDGRFQPIYLRNLRLWQLMLMCGIVWELRRVRSQLPVPLEVAHLILVQSSPLSIRFRSDEKQFDVDGAYNIRYEIVKKRIDKARVRGSKEQVTQPEQIAIVYSHPREAAEYAQYIEFLRASGYLEGPVEELQLEDLQGARGLEALRVTVAREPAEPALVESVRAFTGAAAD